MAQSGSGPTKSGAKRKAAAKKGGQASARKRASKKTAGTTANKAASGARSAGVEAKTVAEFRDALRKNLIKPLEMVMLSRDRIEEVLGEAVDQGRVTTRDAQRIATGLVKRGEKQTKDVLGDLEVLARARQEGSRSRGARAGRQAAARGGRRPELPDHALRRPDRGPDPEAALPT